MADKQEIELINKLISENGDLMDFVLELQGYPQIQKNPETVQFAMKTWQQTYQVESNLNTAA